MLGNIFRLQYFWDLCFGGGVPMRWASFDQKPSWFNNAGLKPLYARRGATNVGSREDHHGTRQRYAVMTSVLSWKRDGQPPPCAVLFKGDTQRAPRVRTYVRKYFTSATGHAARATCTYVHRCTSFLCEYVSVGIRSSACARNWLYDCLRTYVF